MTVNVYVPADTTACALGADDVAAAISAEAARRGIPLRLVRNGSRGAFWLEPLVEVELPGELAGELTDELTSATTTERYAFGPVAPQDVPGLFDAGFATQVVDHPLALGPVAAIPWLARQQRITFARAGVIDPLSLADYRAHGGFSGLERALALSPQAIVDVITASGLRGRGGAAFPAGVKWQTVLDAPGPEKYIVCNADEGDSGTFADRLLLEADPFQLIEGMLIAGLAVGAEQGYIYLRSEYPRARDVLRRALALAHEAGYLGPDIRGSGRRFDLHLRMGAGAYICGEETALLESLEGRRGTVRAKPPLPALCGLFGKPTVVNNVLTLAAASSILAQGADAYAGLGSGRSRGTLTLQLAGNLRQGGLVEVAFGASLREVLDTWGGGSFSGRPLRAIQVGGPLGAYLTPQQWDTPLDYEAFAAAGAMLGHGGVVAFDDSVDMAEQAHFAMAFCAHESCGKCTPCRIGAVRGVEVIDRIRRGERRAENLALLEDLCDTMADGSLCAMGGLTPMPVRSALRHFPDDFQRSHGGHSGADPAATLIARA